jgi:hypothetical protein
VVFLYRDKSIVNIFFLILLGIAVHVHFFLVEPVLIIGKDDGMFSVFLQSTISSIPSTFIFIGYELIVLIQAIRLNMVLTEFRMFPQTNYTTAMTYVLFTGLVGAWSSISPALISNSLVLWLFILLTRLYNNQSPRTLLFNIGLLVSITILAYHPTAILILVVLFALAVVRPFRIAEWLVLLMGVMMPYYFLLAYLFMTNQLQEISRFIPGFQFHLPVQITNYWLIASLGYLFLALLVGIYFWQIINNRMVIQIRKNWAVMMVLLLILLPVPFVFYDAAMDSAILLLIPITAFVANAFGNPKRLFIPNLLFWIAILLVIHNNWDLIKK